MKITIQYSNEPHLAFNYFATTTYLDKNYTACSDISFEDARTKLVKQITDKALLPVPEPEEVEIRSNKITLEKE